MAFLLPPDLARPSRPATGQTDPRDPAAVLQADLKWLLREHFGPLARQLDAAVEDGDLDGARAVVEELSTDIDALRHMLARA